MAWVLRWGYTRAVETIVQSVTSARAPTRALPRGLLLRLASLPLCLGLLGAIAAVSAVGTAVTTDVYRHPLFLALLAGLAANITACAITRRRRGLQGVASIAAHLSVLLILAAGAVSVAFGEEAYVELIRGEATSEGIGRDGRPVPFGFSIELLEAGSEHDPEPEKLLLVGLPHLRIEEEIRFEGPGSRRIPGVPHRIVIERDIPDFAALPDVPEAVRGIATLAGPAVRIVVEHPDGRRDRRWLFARQPALDVNSGADPGVRTHYLQRRPVANWASRVLLRDDRGRVETVVRVNEPGAWGPWRILQHGYDERWPDRTVLRLSLDPGVPIAYLGIALLCCGVTARVWLPGGPR